VERQYHVKIQSTQSTSRPRRDPPLAVVSYCAHPRVTDTPQQQDLSHKHWPGIHVFFAAWTTTLEDTEKLNRFCHFINTSATDPNIVTVEERGQKRPAYSTEREALIPVDFIPVR